MSGSPPSSLWAAYLESIAELGREYPDLRLIAPPEEGAVTPQAFEREFPDRFSLARSSAAEDLRAAARLGSPGAPVFVSTLASTLAQEYGTVREAIARPRANVKLVARFPWPGDPSRPSGPTTVEDVGLMRGLPGMTVVVPADAPTTRGAVRAVAAFDGPAYLRVAHGAQPVLSGGEFVLGRATMLRDGKDLTVVSAGPLLAAAVALADEFARVGVSLRVLDLASVKPIDAPALLRAARDTGAVLVVEEHNVLTGLGEAVAATIAENFSVPVRKVGLPDLFEAPASPEGILGPAADRLRDEAWELLRLRGKVQ